MKAETSVICQGPSTRSDPGEEKSPLKITFLDQSGQLGGAELMLLDLIPQMRGQAQVILLEQGPFCGALLAKGIPVHVIGSQEGKVAVTKQAGLPALVRSIPRVWRMARQVARFTQGADILYANTPKAWIIGALAARQTGIPLICHLHDILSKRHFSAVNRWLMAQAANRMASAVIANSQASAEAFVGAGGQARLVKVVPNGFDPVPFETNINPHGSLREQCGIGHASLAVMAGRIAPWKGQDVFIRAIAASPGVHGAIVGEALFTEEDRSYGASLRELALLLGCAGRIHFCGFRGDMPSIMKEADVVVHCSVAPEPFGRVIVEAMLSARPVIASAQGGALEIVEEGRTGWFHPPGDAAALAACILKILNVPEKAKRVGLMARETARARYSLPHIARQTEQLIEWACAA